MIYAVIFSFLLSFPTWATNKQVYGRDARVQLTSKSIESIHKSIGMLIIEAKDGTSNVCTGNVIGPRHVLTASHCLPHDLARIHFVPGSLVGLNNPLAKNLPANSFTTTIVRRYDHRKWFKSTQNDLAIVLFKKNLRLPVMKFSKYFYNGEIVTLAGYPVDKPNGTLWEASGRMNGSSYTIDTFGGQSGAAVRNTHNEIVAIHSGAVPIRKVNEACVINSKHLKFITYWLKHF